MSVLAMRRVLLTLAAVGVLLLLSSMVAGAATRAHGRGAVVVVRTRAPHALRVPTPPGGPFSNQIPGTACEVASGDSCGLPACREFLVAAAGDQGRRATTVPRLTVPRLNQIVPLGRDSSGCRRQSQPHAAFVSAVG